MSRRIVVRKKRQNGFSVALVIMVILMLMIVITFGRIELQKKQDEYTLKEQQLLEQIEAEEQRAEEIEEYRKYTQTQKYVEEVAKEKLGLVNENEIILDNCMGAGSTGVACQNTGRKFIGIELDDKYFEISKSRLNEAVEKKEELLKVFDKNS